MQGRPKEFSKPDALNAAVDVFWRQGFAAASMADLLAEMNISRQSAYDTFGDKRDLFVQALDRYCVAARDQFQALFAPLRSPVQRLRAFLRFLSEKAATSDGRGCFLTNTIVEVAPHDPLIRASVSRVLHTLQELLADTVSQAVAAGELAPATDPVRLARLLLTVMQGSLVLSKTNLGAGVQDALALLDAAVLQPAPRRP